MTQNFKQRFNIIRRTGDPKEATTIWGHKIIKQDKVFVIDYTIGGQTYTGFVPVLDYGNHFCYELPDDENTAKFPSYLCTCGSFGVFIGSSGYSGEASPSGLQLACYHRSVMFDKEKDEFYHRHADGSS